MVRVVVMMIMTEMATIAPTLTGGTYIIYLVL